MMNRSASATRRPSGSTATAGCCPMLVHPQQYLSTFATQAPLPPPPMAHQCLLGASQPSSQQQPATNAPQQAGQQNLAQLASVTSQQQEQIAATTIGQQAANNISNATNQSSSPQHHQANPARHQEHQNSSFNPSLAAHTLPLHHLLANQHSATQCVALAAALASATSAATMYQQQRANLVNQPVNSQFFVNTFSTQAPPPPPPAPIVQQCLLGTQQTNQLSIPAPSNPPQQQPVQQAHLVNSNTGSAAQATQNGPHQQQAQGSTRPDHSNYNASLPANSLPLHHFLANQHPASHCMALAAALASTTAPASLYPQPHSNLVNQPVDHQASEPVSIQAQPQQQQQQQQPSQQPQPQQQPQQPQTTPPIPFYSFPQMEQALALFANPQVASNLLGHVFNIYLQNGLRTEPHHTHHHHHPSHHYHHHMHGSHHHHHHHHGPNGQNNGQDETMLTISESKPRGLNRAEIDSLTPYIQMNEKDSRTCVICLSKFELKSKIRPLPCNHAFHAKCVDKWLRANRSCPICRRDALKSFGGKIKRI